MGEIANLNQIVAEIKFFENQAVVSYWEIGKRLSQAKEQLNHGEWQSWIDANLGYSYDTANNLIKVFNQYPNIDTYQHLNFSKVLALTSIKDEEDRQNFIDSHEVEDMTTRKLQAEIKKYKRSLEETEDELKAAKAGLEFKDGQIERYSNERSRLAAELELAKMKKVEPQIVEKEVIKEVVPEDYEDLKEQLDDLIEIQKDLQNQLYEAQKNPKEVVKEVERGDIKYYKSEIKRLEDDLQKEITKNLSLINDKKLAISQLETEEAHKKRVSDITSMHYSIAGFLRSIGGQLYLTEYLEEVTPRERNLYLDSVKHLREFSEQLYLNCEEAIKKYRS